MESMGDIYPSFWDTRTHSAVCSAQALQWSRRKVSLSSHCQVVSTQTGGQAGACEAITPQRDSQEIATRDSQPTLGDPKEGMCLPCVTIAVGRNVFTHLLSTHVYVKNTSYSRVPS